MSYGFLDIAMTASVRAEQARMDSEHIWQPFDSPREFDRFDDKVATFITARDSFYVATVSETGWPYVQHRGGPPGFLKVIDDKTLAFANYRGNRQYISAGNLAANSRMCLFLMDYPQRLRLKIYVQAEMLTLDQDPDLTARLLKQADNVKPERICRMQLQAYDWNCRRHITPRFSQQQVEEAVAPLHQRLAELESENSALRLQLGQVERDWR